MHTFYVRYYRKVPEGVATWMPGTLIRVTRNRLGREVREYPGNMTAAPPLPSENEVQMNVDWMHFMIANAGIKPPASRAARGRSA